MKVIEKILYYIFVIGYLYMPVLANYVLERRGITLPSDLAGYGTIIWYVSGVIQMYWHNRPKETKD